jgi:ABC-2 type transport system ATP-binding protein
MSKVESAVQVRGVSKDFRLPHENVNSLKQLILNRKRSKYIETQHALNGIDLDIKKGEFFGIVGRNGSGKSTLLKILAGIYQPTSGSVETVGSLVPFIELGVGFNPELSGRDNIYLNGALLGFSRKQIDLMYKEIVDFAELERFMDQKVKNYSSGMQVRLAFAIAVKAKTDILLIDEVLAVGDTNFQRKCFKYFNDLKNSDTTVVFVTHDMDAVATYCDRAAVIDKSQLTFVGDVKSAISHYKALNASTQTLKTKHTRKKTGLRLDGVSVSGDLATGGQAAIEVSLRGINNSNRDDRVVIGLAVYDSFGNKIAGPNSLEETFICGDKNFRFTTTQLPLPEDEYTLSVVLFNHNATEQIDSLDDAAKFDVSGTSKSFGNAVLIGSWSKGELF